MTPTPSVHVGLPGLSTSVRLNRGEFEAMIAPTIEDSVKAMRRALRSAGLLPDQLTAIVLTGGSSRIPLVTHTLHTAFGRPLALDTHPKHDVALGATLVTRHTQQIATAPSVDRHNQQASTSPNTTAFRPRRSTHRPDPRRLPLPPRWGPAPRRGSRNRTNPRDHPRVLLRMVLAQCHSRELSPERRSPGLRPA